MTDGYYSRRQQRRAARLQREREAILRKWGHLGEKIGAAVFGTAPAKPRAFGHVVARVKGRAVEDWRGELVVHLLRGVDYEIR